MPVQGAGPGEGAPRCLSAGRAGAVEEGEDRTESGKPPGAADFEQRPERKKAGVEDAGRGQEGAREKEEDQKGRELGENTGYQQAIPAGPELEVTGGKTDRDPAKQGSGARSRRKLCVTTDSVQSARGQRAPCEPARAAAAASERSEGGSRPAEQRQRLAPRQTDRQTGECRGQGGGAQQAEGPGTAAWQEAGGVGGCGGLGACVAPGSAPVLGGGPLIRSDQSLSRVRLFATPMTRSTPGLPVHDQLPEFTQTHVHRVSDAIQPSHPLSSSSPPAPNPSQHQSLFQ